MEPVLDARRGALVPWATTQTRGACRAGDLAINSLKTLRVHNVGISAEDLAASLPGVDVVELYEPDPDSSESDPESSESDEMSD